MSSHGMCAWAGLLPAAITERSATLMEGSFLKRWQASLRSRWSVLPSICTYPTPAHSACPVPSSSCASFLMTSLHRHCQFRQSSRGLTLLYRVSLRPRWSTNVVALSVALPAHCTYGCP